MNVTIYNPDQQEPEQELCLRMVRGESLRDRVQIIAVNPRTGRKIEGGVLIEFQENGTFARAPCVRAAGIETDANGRIKERDF